MDGHTNGTLPTPVDTEVGPCNFEENFNLRLNELAVELIHHFQFHWNSSQWIYVAKAMQQ